MLYASIRRFNRRRQNSKSNSNCRTKTNWNRQSDHSTFTICAVESYRLACITLIDRNRRKLKLRSTGLGLFREPDDLFIIGNLVEESLSF